MQLVLDETVVTRFQRAKGKIDALLISSSGAGSGRGGGGGRGGGMGRTDRRDPLWRQKLFRGEGVHYYSNVSLFRAGEKIMELRETGGELHGRRGLFFARLLLCGREPRMPAEMAYAYAFDDVLRGEDERKVTDHQSPIVVFGVLCPPFEENGIFFCSERKKSDDAIKEYLCILPLSHKSVP